MRHFNYFENGGPAPSSCISCGAVKQLFEVGQLQYGGMAQVCRKCVIELATFIGYTEEAPYEQAVAEAMKRNADLEVQLNKVPNLVDGLINGIRSSVTDFIFAVSYSDSASEPEAISDIPVSNSGEHEASKAASRQRKAPSKSTI